MYRWYQMAAVCYAYLEDVHDLRQLAESRYWTRAWTLQELIAPKNMEFYNMNWAPLGTKAKLQIEIQKITGIDHLVLKEGTFDHVCVAKRMAWAANRQATRLEDIAYSLMGIFNVNMPMLYGEGRKAFIRLQVSL